MQASRTNYSRTTYLTLCGLFAAVMAICSVITIPLGFTPVPINLGTLGVFLVGGLLGKKYGTISMSVYVLLGAVGVPIFSGFRGGVGVLAGPTGGYIIGYIVAAFIIGLLIEKMSASSSWAAAGAAGRSAEADAAAEITKPRQSTGKELAAYAAAMLAGLAACYLLGTLWFIVSTHTGVWASLLSCVIPFLPGDFVKIAAAALLVQRLRRHI